LRGRAGVTLLEVLVVIGIIGLLVGVLVPGLNHSRRIAKQTACLAGLQQLGVATCTYAMENGGSVPFGQRPPPPSARNFYTKEGQTTSIISDLRGRHVGLGLLLETNLPNSKESLFCPAADGKWDVKASLALVGKGQVESSYYYRHGSISELTPVGGPPPRVQLDSLGSNRRGQPIRTLAMDTQFIAPDTMSVFNIYSRTHHQQKAVNVLYTDAHASTHQNANNRFRIDLSLTGYQTIDRILSTFEELDSEP
jgi:prepilin-type N-terminal cleavage/methylation domain-containing protein